MENISIYTSTSCAELYTVASQENVPGVNLSWDFYVSLHVLIVPWQLFQCFNFLHIFKTCMFVSVVAL